MRRVNVHEAKTHLSRLLAEIGPGDVILVCRNNKPVAELRAVSQERTEPRPWGPDRGVLRVPEDFNAPLPDDELDVWEPQ